MKLAALVGVALASLVGFSLQGQREGGPPAVYRVEVPVSELDVIAGAPTETSIVLSIRGKHEPSPTLTILNERGKPVSPPIFQLASGVPLEVPVKGLQPGTTYTYTLTQGDEKVEGRFTTARKAGQEFTFAIQADSHLDGNTDLKVLERTHSNILKDKPDFLVDLGDTFMVDKYPKYQDALKQYEAQRYWFSRLGSQMSVFLCLGNHDGEVGWPSRGGGDMAGWSQEQRERNFPVIRANDFYSGAPKKGLWYSYNWGDATLIILDPFVATTRKTRGDEDGWNWTLGKEQFDWFAKTLKESKSKFKFVFIHHLVGGFGGAEARGGVEAADRFEWGNKEEFPVKREGWAEPIHALMVKHGVTAMFHGHDHLYVSQEKDGIVYLEVPQPGQPRDNAIGSAERYGYKSGTILGSSGHIRVTVGPKAAKLEYVKSLAGAENGKVVDSLEIAPRAGKF